MSQPKATQDALFARLTELEIETTTVSHEAVFTVAESSRLYDQLPGGHTKNLMLKDAKGRLFLVIAEANTSIEMKKLHKRIDCARLSFAKPELLDAVLGVTPGSVTAFSLINDTDQQISVIFDEALTSHDIINCHPLVNTATTAIARDDLLRFIRACGHEPRIMALSSPDADQLH